MPMDTERHVAEHYGRTGLEQKILAALAAAGIDIDRLTTADLAAGDEFHLGWRAATAALAADLGLEPGMRVLDIGSGLGGPARYFAEAHGCTVVGVDITESYVDVANSLTARCGLTDRASFELASALSLPFDAAEFDAATMIHVGMNILDKAGVFAEARRVLKPGGRFAVYDVMRTGDGAIPYPMPWAATEATSFVEPVARYRGLLEAAGFTVESETSRRELALRLAAEMREKAAKDGPPPFGLHILMGPATPERLGNILATVQAGTVSPVQLIARAR
jgi:ubiquinone/menaquinone biosynthesis C-methylase UbiE